MSAAIRAPSRGGESWLCARFRRLRGRPRRQIRGTAEQEHVVQGSRCTRARAIRRSAGSAAVQRSRCTGSSATHAAARRRHRPGPCLRRAWAQPALAHDRVRAVGEEKARASVVLCARTKNVEPARNPRGSRRPPGRPRPARPSSRTRRARCTPRTPDAFSRRRSPLPAVTLRRGRARLGGRAQAPTRRARWAASTRASRAAFGSERLSEVRARRRRPWPPARGRPCGSTKKAAGRDGARSAPTAAGRPATFAYGAQVEGEDQVDDVQPAVRGRDDLRHVSGCPP